MRALSQCGWGAALLVAASMQAQTVAPPGGTASSAQPSAVQMQPPNVPALSGPVAEPNAPAPQLTRDADGTSLPAREGALHLAPDFWGFLGPYSRPVVPPLLAGDATRMDALIRDGKLYLTLQDAIALAIENNLDVEAERYDLLLARTDEARAAGGGSTRGLDYNVTLPPNGVGGPGSPLLNAATANSNPTTPTVTDLTSLNSTLETTQSLSEAGTGTYSAGPNVPLFDPQLIGEAGYLRRSDTVNLTSTAGATNTPPGPALSYTELNVAYMEGFSTGAQLEAVVNNDSEVLYGASSKYDPFYAPSTSVTLTQPLLRGFGREVNLRYVRIAATGRKISRLLFEQQVMNTIYGTSRLYYDLVSLGENVKVKSDSLKAATKMREDDEEQEKLGTLAPIDLMRAQALETSSRFDLIQAQGLYKQEEIILRDQLLRTASPVFRAKFSEIVPTDKIVVPETAEAMDVDALVAEGLAARPDLLQAKLQVEQGRISVKAAVNDTKPQLNVYANVETRGANEQPYETLGSAGTGLPTIPQELAAGGLRTSTIVQAGVQLTLPLRNRVAESDAARDQVQLRQVEARTEKMSQQVREDIETAIVALETARAAYDAAVHSREYQGHLLDAERDKLSVGQSTDLAVMQNEAYLSQALSTEIAARSDWMKARIELDRALGDLLEKNHVQLDDAIAGKLP